jgi:drug/metabolite transporter (DMT)-like permease
MVRKAAPVPTSGDRVLGGLPASTAPAPGRGTLALLLSFVLLAFAANSLITRYVVTNGLADPGLLTGVRMLAGAVALLAVALIRRDRVRLGRRTVLPAVALGVYAVCISYGYVAIGAAAGTFVFYAAVMATLVASDLLSRTAVPPRRRLGAGVALLGVAVLTAGRVELVTPLGVLLLALTGVAWGVYTALGRSAGDPRLATTANFTLLAAVLIVPTGVGVAAGLHLSAAGLAWGVGMGAGTTAFAYVAWYACQRALTGTAAGSTQLAIPVLTTLGAVLLLGERLSWTLLVAAVLVGLGLWLNRPVRPSEPSRPPPAGT